MDQHKAFFTPIFDHLSKGLFLYADSRQANHYQYYQYLHNHRDTFARQIVPLGFRLEEGTDYYYLSRPGKPIIWEDRKTRIFRLLDIVDFCYTYNPAWETGTEIAIQKLEEACQRSPVLSRKLQQLSLSLESKDTGNKLQQMFRLLERGGFAECLDESKGLYWISPAYAYLDQMFQALYIQI